MMHLCDIHESAEGCEAKGLVFLGSCRWGGCEVHRRGALRSGVLKWHFYNRCTQELQVEVGISLGEEEELIT